MSSPLGAMRRSAASLQWLADDADQALGEDGDEGRGHEVVFDAHVGEAGDGARGVVGVEGGIDEVTG